MSMSVLQIPVSMVVHVSMTLTATGAYVPRGGEALTVSWTQMSVVVVLV